MAASSAEHFWNRAIAATARRINTVMWLDVFAPLAFGVGVAAAIAHYMSRRLQLAVEWAGWACVAAVLVCAGWAAWRTRTRRLSKQEARVWLESTLRLDARLTAACEGVAAWPTPRRLPRGLLRWRGRTTAVWLAAALALVVAGMWLPVPARDVVPAVAQEKPPALVEAEAWLEALRKLDVVEPESVEQLAARAEELARLSPKDQYSHAGLEAADALRNQTAGAMQNLAQAMDNASSALRSMEAAEGALTPEQMKSAAARLDAALRGMREGTLAARADLAKACEACLADPRSLSPGRAAQLQKALAAASGQMRGVRGATGAGAVIAQPGELAGVLAPGAGQGGVDRGPGEAPLTFSPDPSDTGPGKLETVSNEDLTRAALGDLLETQKGEHDLDPTKMQGVTSAGALRSGGAGGEAVWVDRLTPAERAALSQFFK